MDTKMNPQSITIIVLLQDPLITCVVPKVGGSPLQPRDIHNIIRWTWVLLSYPVELEAQKIETHFILYS